jgi:pilus assembly protein FimV
MIRKLSLAIAVATALSPLGAFALGLGEIHSQSALNQNFKAEIDLLSVKPDELSDVRVSLASPEAFTKAGIERLFMHSTLKFTPSLTADGRVVVVVSSKDPVREPFLNFLVEVNWPKGRLLREYTVLLDPPVTLDRAPARMEAPRTTTRAVVQPSRVSQPRAMVTSSYTSAAGGGREYGPIQLHDNLWSIAKGMRQEGETIEQVMMALHRYNPDAFIRDNVNGLKVGRILRLPEGADVTSVSHREARKEFLAQTQEWRENQQASAVAPTATGTSTTAGAAPEPTDRLELASSRPEDAAEAQDREGKAETGGQERLQQELMLLKEENVSARQENEVLQSRVRDLEAQIKDIQRLLTLKSDQLTELQTVQQIVEEKSEALEAAQEEAVQEGVAPEETEVATAEPEMETPVEEVASAIPTTAAEAVVPVPEGTVIEEVNIEAVIAEAMQTEQAAQTPMAEPEVTAQPMPGEETTAQPSVQTAIAEPPAQPQAEPTPEAMAPEPKKPSGFLDILTGNPTLMGMLGGVGLILLGLLWLIMRRRKEAEAEFAESILVTPEAGAGEAGQGIGSSVNEPTDETSFMSDFSPSDIDALQDETGEVDPLSEADVYIAYGRYQQAEELIKQAIDQNPLREELKHKLLEIYYSSKNSVQFNKLAGELKEAGLERDKPDIWSRIVTMGKELDPANALFAAAGAAGAAAAASSLAEDDKELDDLGLSLGSEFNTEGLSTGGEATTEAQGGELDSMDLSGLDNLDNLDQMDSVAMESEMALDSEFLNNLESETEETPVMEKGGLDFDVGTLDEPDTTEAPAASDDTDLDAISFDLDETPVDEASTPVELGLDDSQNLDDLDLESLEKELEMLSGDFDAQPESPVEPAAEADNMLSLEPMDEADGEAIDFDSTDEVATKLDLARAYVDMGDAEGARSILEEVVNEGTEEQKQQAQELLGGLSG